MALSQAKNTVIPAKAGIQPHQQWLRPLDSGMRRNDDKGIFIEQSRLRMCHPGQCPFIGKQLTRTSHRVAR